MSTGTWVTSELGIAADAWRSIQAEQERHVQKLARDLIEASRIYGRGSGDPYWDSIHWLDVVAEEGGYAVLSPRATQPWSWQLTSDSTALVGTGWPPAAHLRLHWLADRDEGWICRDCGIGLIDVCSDEDMATGSDGGRVIRPGCAKRLPTVDHKVPRALGGSDDPINKELVCGPCNSRKGAS